VAYFFQIKNEMADCNYSNPFNSITALWRRATVIGCIIIFIACSPQKKLERLIKKHPELVQKDTIIVRDTVYTKDIHTDTVFFSFKKTDTFYLEKEKLKIQIIKKYDTLKVSADVKRDTVFLEKKIPVEKLVVKKDFSPLLNKLIILSLLLLIIIFLYDKRKN